jgi:hypothetical protein
MSTSLLDLNLHGYTATDLHDCALRELKLRRRLYPDFVASNRLTQQLADREIGRMAAIAEHFAELAERERLL